MSALPTFTPFVDYSPQTPITAAWLNAVTQVLFTGVSGSSANRPTVNLYIGMPFFDTTLGQPIWMKQVSPAVWVNAAGVPV